MTRRLGFTGVLAFLSLALPANAVEETIVLRAENGRTDAFNAEATTKAKVVGGVKLVVSGFIERERNHCCSPREYYDAFYEFDENGEPESDSPIESFYAGPVEGRFKGYNDLIFRMMNAAPPAYDADHTYEVVLDKFPTAWGATRWRFMVNRFTNSTEATLSGEIKVDLDIPATDATSKFSFKTNLLPDKPPQRLVGVQLESKGRVDFENLDTALLQTRSRGTLAIALETTRTETLTVLDLKGDAELELRNHGAVRILRVPTKVRRSSMRGCKDGKRGTLALVDYGGTRATDQAELSWCGRTYRWKEPESKNFELSIQRPH